MFDQWLRKFELSIDIIIIDYLKEQKGTYFYKKYFNPYMEFSNNRFRKQEKFILYNNYTWSYNDWCKFFIYYKQYEQLFWSFFFFLRKDFVWKEFFYETRFYVLW